MNKVELAEKCARLTTFPKIKEFKISACKSFIIDAFLYGKNELKKQDIKTYCKESHEVSDIPEIIFGMAIEELIKDNIISRQKDVFIIEEDKRKELEKQSINNIKIFNEMIGSFIKVLKKYHSSIDSQDESLIRNNFIEILHPIIQDMDNKLIDFLEGTDKSDPFFKDRFNVLLEDLNNKFFSDKQLAISFINALKESFNKPNYNFSQGVFLLAQNSTILDIIGRNIDVENYKRNIINKNTIYLDTNIIISALCNASNYHSPTLNVLNATNDIGIKIKILDITEGEFLNSCENAVSLKNEREGIFPIEDGFNEIIDTYKNLAKYYDDFDDFVEQLQDEYTLFKRRFNIEKVDTSKFNYKKYELSLSEVIISKVLLKYGSNINPSNIRHDAKAITAIQMLRQENSKEKKILHWFLTRHQKLMEPDRTISSIIFKSNYLSSVRIDTWIEAIYPFISVKYNQEISKGYVMDIGHSLIPLIEIPDVRTFLKYTLPFLGVKKKDEKYYIGKIERHKNKHLIEKHLEKGDNVKALTEFVDILKSQDIEGEKEIETLQSRIKRQQQAIAKLRKMKQPSYHVVTTGNGNIVQTGGSQNKIISDNTIISKQIADVKDSLKSSYPQIKEDIETRFNGIQNESKEEGIERLKSIRGWFKTNANLHNITTAMTFINNLILLLGGSL